MSEQTTRAPDAWRRAIALLTASLWLVLLAACLHRSGEPAVLGRWSARYAVVLLALAVLTGAVTALNLRRLAAWSNALRRPGLALLLGVLLGSVVLEVLIRCTDPLGISYFEESKRYHLAKLPDAELIYRNPPGLDASYQGVRVTTNAQGFRDDAVVAKPPGGYRVLLLGDSVAFGWGVAQDEIFAARLEPLLSAALARPVDVINTGVGSYNTVQELAVLRRYGESLESDAVILLYVYNDVDEQTRPFDPGEPWRMEGRNIPGRIEILLGSSWTYRLVRVLLARQVDAPSTASQASAERPRGWKRSLEALESIAGWCARRGLPFVLFVWRSGRRADDRLWQDLEARGRAAGFPVVEVSPSWIPVGKHRLSHVDGHPDAEGHRVLAEGMARYLAREIARRR